VAQEYTQAYSNNNTHKRTRQIHGRLTYAHTRKTATIKEERNKERKKTKLGFLLH
jgi:hypothetical protein